MDNVDKAVGKDRRQSTAGSDAGWKFGGGRLVCKKNGLAVAETRKSRLRLAECRGYVIVSAKKPVSCIYSAHLPVRE